MAKFDQQKRNDMERAREQIFGATAEYIGTKDLSVKQEVLLKRDDPTWAPRVIYAGNDAFNTITGPAMMVAMERLCCLMQTEDDNPNILPGETKYGETIGGVKAMFAYKSDDVKLVRHLNQPGFPDTVEGDFSRNDREQRKRVAYLIDCWLDILGFPNWLRSLMFRLESYKVQSRAYGFRARLKYQLPTGTTATTFRNSSYNLTMFAVACTRQNIKARANILGDDILAVLTRRFRLDLWIQTVASFKMVLKAKAPQLDGKATFLSRRIIMEHDYPCMLPLIGKALARFNARGTSNPTCSDSQYMAGKALSYAYEFRHVPSIRDIFLERFEMEDDGSKVTQDELTWFTRTSGIDINNIVQCILSEKVIVPDDTFCGWLITHFDIGLIDTLELCRSIVLNPNLEYVSNPMICKFSVDYE